MAVDNQRVHAYLQEALDRRSEGSLTDRLYGTLSDLMALRDGGRCDDDSLAAADHYMHMRWATAMVGPALNGTLGSFVMAYDGLYKAVDEAVRAATGLTIVIKTGNCPPSRFSPLFVAWALKGLADGNADFLFRRWQSSPRLVAPYRPGPPSRWEEVF